MDTTENLFTIFSQPLLHAFASHDLSKQGLYITTNITHVPLVSISENVPHARFIALHGTLLDLTKGRGKNQIYHRPRSLVDLEAMQGEIPANFRGKRTRSPIPTGKGRDTLEDDDPNLQEAREAFSYVSPTTLLIMGNSLSTTTNGNVMRFMTSAPYCLTMSFIRIALIFILSR